MICRWSCLFIHSNSSRIALRQNDRISFVIEYFWDFLCLMTMVIMIKKIFPNKISFLWRVSQDSRTFPYTFLSLFSSCKISRCCFFYCGGAMTISANAETLQMERGNKYSDERRDEFALFLVSSQHTTTWVVSNYLTLFHDHRWLLVLRCSFSCLLRSVQFVVDVMNSRNSRIISLSFPCCFFLWSSGSLWPTEVHTMQLK